MAAWLVDQSIAPRVRLQSYDGEWFSFRMAGETVMSFDADGLRGFAEQLAQALDAAAKREERDAADVEALHQMDRDHWRAVFDSALSYFDGRKA